MAEAGAPVGLYERNELLALAWAACARARDGEGSAVFVSVDAGLVDGDGRGSAKFVHPLFRQILYQDLPAPMRTRTHALAMRALLANGASTAEAAAHAVLGGAIGDETAIEVLVSAGRSALNGGDVETAVAQLTTAVELAGTNASADLLLLLSAAMNAAGRPAASTATAEQVPGRASVTREHRVQAFCLLAHAAFVAGRPRDAYEQFLEARAAATGIDRYTLLDTLLDAASRHTGGLSISWTWRVEPVPVGSAWCEIARADVDQELGLPVSARCTAIASSLGSHLDSYPLLWLWLWAVQGDSLVDEGRPDLAADLLARCRPLAEQAGIRDPLVVPWARSAVEAAAFANRVDQAEAEAQFLEALSWLETTTLPLFSGRVLLGDARYLRHSSRRTEARPVLARALSIARTCSGEKLSLQAGDEL